MDPAHRFFARHRGQTNKAGQLFPGAEFVVYLLQQNLLPVRWKIQG
jgi:hypothetical protein